MSSWFDPRLPYPHVVHLSPFAQTVGPPGPNVMSPSPYPGAKAPRQWTHPQQSLHTETRPFAPQHSGSQHSAPAIGPPFQPSSAIGAPFQESISSQHLAEPQYPSDTLTGVTCQPPPSLCGPVRHLSSGNSSGPGHGVIKLSDPEGSVAANQTSMGNRTTAAKVRLPVVSRWPQHCGLNTFQTMPHRSAGVEPQRVPSSIPPVVPDGMVLRCPVVCRKSCMCAHLTAMMCHSGWHSSQR